jgi:glycosyltransferase involved in cell wall biosynthesis
MCKYVLYDYLQVSGGAERLSIELARGLPGFQLVVSRVFEQAKFLTSDEVSGIDNLRCVGSAWTKPLRRNAEAAVAFRFGTRFLRNAKTVIYSGLYAPFAVDNQLGGRRVYYCHTLPRYAYDWHERYMLGMPPLLRPAARLGIAGLRHRYEASLAQMDKIIVNSENVRERMRKHLGIESEVIYPPVDTERFKWIRQGNYFVSLARLEAHKRVDVIIKAFLGMRDQHLVIASGGRDEARLKALADGASNIIFTGWQTDTQLREWIGSARAAVYVPSDEDFGMSPVEAMSAGKPVIGVREGGLVETVMDGKTGILVSPQLTVEALREAIATLNPSNAFSMRAACEKQALRFTREAFIDRMNVAVHNS